MGNKAYPFQINRDSEHANKINNKTVLDWLDFKVIKGTFGNGIGLNIKIPSITTNPSAKLESP